MQVIASGAAPPPPPPRNGTGSAAPHARSAIGAPSTPRSRTTGAAEMLGGSHTDTLPSLLPTASAAYAATLSPAGAASRVGVNRAAVVGRECAATYTAGCSSPARDSTGDVNMGASAAPLPPPPPPMPLLLLTCSMPQHVATAHPSGEKSILRVALEPGTPAYGARSSPTGATRRLPDASRLPDVNIPLLLAPPLPLTPPPRSRFTPDIASSSTSRSL